MGTQSTWEQQKGTAERLKHRSSGRCNTPRIACVQPVSQWRASSRARALRVHVCVLLPPCGSCAPLTLWASFGTAVVVPHVFGCPLQLDGLVGASGRRRCLAAVRRKKKRRK